PADHANVETAALSADPLVNARQLATTGRRSEALAQLSERLQSHPTDSDARIFYGIVLSWDGKYDEARAQLKQVLASSPQNSDALGALINVELWSGHPEEAEAAIQRALPADPINVRLLLTRVRTLKALNRTSDALWLVKDVLMLEPANEEAR